MSDPMNTYPWTPTLRLRQVRMRVPDVDGPSLLPASVGVRNALALQQQWRNVTSGETEWREIETVESED